jgi:hypothetical protein
MNESLLDETIFDLITGLFSKWPAQNIVVELPVFFKEAYAPGAFPFRTVMGRDNSVHLTLQEEGVIFLDIAFPMSLQRMFFVPQAADKLNPPTVGFLTDGAGAFLNNQEININVNL